MNGPLDLSGNYKLAMALLAGLVLGFALVKSDLVWRKNVMDALRLRDGRILKSVFLMLGLGTLLYDLACRAGMLESPLVHSSYLWSSLFGGILSGIGLVLAAATPMTAIASLAAGRFQMIWVLIGMALAIPAVNSLSGPLSEALRNHDPSLEPASFSPEFFTFGNPALYIIGTMIALILLVHYTAGDSSD